MFAHAHTHPLLARLRALAAAGSIALVVLLNILAASPQAHALLHSHDDAPAPGCAHDHHHAHSHDHADHPEPAAHDDHTCAISLFAQGVSHTVAVIAVPAPAPLFQDLAPAHARELFVLPPRYLRLPERGPPTV